MVKLSSVFKTFGNLIMWLFYGIAIGYFIQNTGGWGAVLTGYAFLFIFLPGITIWIVGRLISKYSKSEIKTKTPAKIKVLQFALYSIMIVPGVFISFLIGIPK